MSSVIILTAIRKLDHTKTGELQVTPWAVQVPVQQLSSLWGEMLLY